MAKFISRTWVPNLFTMANLSMGFFSILLTLKNPGSETILAVSGLLIILAAFCDGLDGFAARLLNAQSELGAQLDSLADLTTFGIAPAVLMYRLVLNEYQLNLEPLGLPIGMYLAVIYPLCAAYRLARFNVKHASDSFQGLPSPVAGVVVALMPLTFSDQVHAPSWALTMIFFMVAFLMVSTVKYVKVQQVVDLRKFSPLRIGLLIAFLVVVVIIGVMRFSISGLMVGLFLLLVLYILTGFISLILQLIQHYRV